MKERKIYKDKSGFALAEIVVALFVTTIAIMLVGALTQQVMNMNKSSKQIAAVIELRGKTAALVKNPDKWLDRMRTLQVPGSGFTYLGCLPPSNSLSTQYTCPVTVMNDAELNAAGLIDNVANTDATDGGRLKAMETPIIDSNGEVIAGTSSDIYYLNSDGVKCTAANPDQNCPFISMGYFLRENVPTSLSPSSLSPGEVKFLVKVQMNPSHKITGVTPMKAQLMTMSLGTGWTKSSVTTGTTCSSSQVFQGINEDGSSKCVDPTTPCPSGKIQVGYEVGGPICEDPSLLGCLDTEKPILDPVGKKLVCSSKSPCSGTGKAFTGLYAGSGEPICEDPANKCAAGSVQMGEKSDGSPDCYAVTTCASGKSLSFDGTKFECVNSGRDIANLGCPAGKIFKGFDSNGDPDCVASPAIICPVGKYLSGIDSASKAICTCLPGTTESPSDNDSCISNFVGFSCADGTYLKGYRDDKSPICEGQAPVSGIQTISKTLPLENPMLVASRLDKTYSLAALFPEISGKRILSVTLSDYGYQKYSSKSCNVKVDSISVSATNPTKKFSFYTISSTVTLNASAQTINLVHAGSTKDGISRACIEDATITIQYQ